jgi:Protein of unknown function (DUF1778).
MVSTITIRTSQSEKSLLQNLADFHGVSLSEFIRNKMIELAEDEFDLRVAEEAIAYNKNHPETYTLEEVTQTLGFDL